jgi:glutamate-5-semialdehyde dehydrogenase
MTIEAILKQARAASYAMATLPTASKNAALQRFADLVAQNTDFLLAENAKDLAQAGDLAPSMRQRLKLDAGKLAQLVQGLRDVAQLPDPVGQVLSATELDTGLVLEKKTVPLGVIAIIFESRPDVIPQILSLILKSGNAVVLKGGREAGHSNAAFMTLVDQLNTACPELPAGWAQRVSSREAIQEVLNYPQYVDLVIPRGSNALVQQIQQATRIPVLGHADGVCHLYVHATADLDQAVPVIIDAKAQYPAACNALETLLIDASVADALLPRVAEEATTAGITLLGCPHTQALLGVGPVTDWHTEYGDLTLAVRVVDGPEAALNHIHTHGSHHTEAILAQDPDAIAWFLNSVDAACVFANASTRFADGFRFGLGAEVGISTAKTHARGPVGLEGLVIYKYLLRGQGQRVAEYVGPDARSFMHRSLG